MKMTGVGYKERSSDSGKTMTARRIDKKKEKMQEKRTEPVRESEAESKERV